MDYGTVGTGENRTKVLKVVNTNPVEVGKHFVYFITFEILKFLFCWPNCNSEIKNWYFYLFFF